MLGPHRQSCTGYRAATRVQRLGEAIHVLRGAWADEPFSYAGRHYRCTDLDLDPRPMQRPGPAIHVGAGGPAMLRLAARQADIVNIANRTAEDGRGVHGLDVGPDAFRAKVDLVRRTALGRLPMPELSVSIRVLAVDDEPGVVYPALREHFAALRGTPAMLHGSVEEVVAEILRWNEDCGISYFVLGEDARAEQLADVITAVRATGR